MKPDPHDEQRSDPGAPAGSDAAEGRQASSAEHAPDSPNSEYRPRPHEHLVEPLFAGLETGRTTVGEGAAPEGSHGPMDNRPGWLRRIWRALRGK